MTIKKAKLIKSYDVFYDVLCIFALDKLSLSNLKQV